jgi:hypothetical protein
LAVLTTPHGPLLVSMPIRRASLAPSEIIVAPVSTRKRTVVPLMLPVVTKWPLPSAVRVALAPPLSRGLRGDVLPDPQPALPAIGLDGRRLAIDRQHRHAFGGPAADRDRPRRPAVDRQQRLSRKDAGQPDIDCLRRQAATKQERVQLAAQRRQLPSDPRGKSIPFRRAASSFGHQLDQAFGHASSPPRKAFCHIPYANARMRASAASERAPRRCTAVAAALPLPRARAAISDRREPGSSSA